GRHLNLVMTIVGHEFAPELEYAFHIDSGKRFGTTTATTTIRCRVPAANLIECRAGDAAYARGDARQSVGIHGKHLRVFAGLRDDPFFNNVKGSRDAYQVAARALRDGTTTDAAGCPRLTTSTSATLLDTWRHTDGGPASNFLVGWTPASIVVAVDLEVVN